MFEETLYQKARDGEEGEAGPTEEGRKDAMEIQEDGTGIRREWSKGRRRSRKEGMKEGAVAR